jgi:hypothetical protein
MSGAIPASRGRTRSAQVATAPPSSATGVTPSRTRGPFASTSLPGCVWRAGRLVAGSGPQFDRGPFPDPFQGEPALGGETRRAPPLFHPISRMGYCKDRSFTLRLAAGCRELGVAVPAPRSTRPPPKCARNGCGTRARLEGVERIEGSLAKPASERWGRGPSDRRKSIGVTRRILQRPLRPRSGVQ